MVTGGGCLCCRGGWIAGLVSGWPKCRSEEHGEERKRERKMKVELSAAATHRTAGAEC
jgi:hypothetical protein